VSVLKNAAELTFCYALCRGALRFCPRITVASNGHNFHSRIISENRGPMVEW